MKTTLNSSDFYVLVFLVLTTTWTCNATPIYVREGLPYVGDGTSWATAYGTLQEALEDPNLFDDVSDEIWVAQGIYLPTATIDPFDDRTATFQMKNDLAIYGGFPPSGEPNLVTRDPELFETILSGDIGMTGDPNNYCYHVFYHPNDLALDGTAILDGFTVAYGNADYGMDPNDYYHGGGMYNYNCAPKILNCHFRDNQSIDDGAGIYSYLNKDGVSLAPLRAIDCTFSDNTCGTNGGGGGIHVDYGKVDVRNCMFINNSAQYGGGLECYNTASYQSTKIINCRFLGNTATVEGGAFAIGFVNEPYMTNCLFSGNHADEKGGAMRLSETNMHLTNCTFWNNSADSAGGAIRSEPDNDQYVPDIANCILWGNTAPSGSQISNLYYAADVTYCDIEGWSGGTGNINADPLFVDPYGLDGEPGTEDDDLRLFDGSQCADAGDNDALLGWITTDLDGNPRYLDDTTMPDTGNGTPPIVDMGAYEYRLTFVVFVKENATGNNDGSTWEDAYTSLQDAMTQAQSDPDVINIWVAEGTYKPTNPIDPNDRYASFRMIDGVGIYGGFDDTGSPNWDDRDPEAYVTILSGDIGTVGQTNDNCYHVFYHPATVVLSNSAVLDGFTITGGNAYGTNPHCYGGGMYNNHDGGFFGCDPTITNCIFTDNMAENGGGGMYNYYNCDLTVTHCTFSNNSVTANGGGGGMYNGSSNPSISNCLFTGNSTFSGIGAGMYNGGLDQDITDCVFTGNQAGGNGGGMYNSDCEMDIVNCIFSGNSADGGGGVYNSWGFISVDRNPDFINCGFYGNSCDNSGGAIYNYYGEPMFVQCIITANVANNASYTYRGGGMFNNNSNSTIANCTIFANSSLGSGSGGGIANHQSFPSVTNSIIYGNTASSGTQINDGPASGTTVDYCDVEGGWAGSGTGNIDAEPMFVDPASDDNIIGTPDDCYKLSIDSPCINIGDSNSLPADIADLDNDMNTSEPLPLDFGNRSRIFDGDGVEEVDMGAYEFRYTDTGDDGDGLINETELEALADNWLDECSEPDWCEYMDINESGIVNLRDFAIIARYWLLQIY